MAVVGSLQIFVLIFGLSANSTFFSCCCVSLQMSEIHMQQKFVQRKGTYALYGQISTTTTIVVMRQNVPAVLVTTKDCPVWILQRKRLNI